MLGEFPLNPILPAADGARAENFHRDVLEPSSFRGVGGEVNGFITDFGPVKSAMFRDSEGNVPVINEIGAL